jgi:Zn-dependent protease
VVLLMSLTVHEAAHGWAALRGGDLTAYLGGQVSLDPRPHIKREPIGMVFAPLLFWFMGGWMLGWASTPIDPRWAYVHPRRAAAMSAAGPLANFALVVMAALAIRLGVAAGFFLPVPLGLFELAVAPSGGVAESLVLVLSLVFSMNLILFVFNLIPVPPLDGASAIGLLLSDAAGRRLQQFMAQPMLAWGGLLVAWFLMRRIVGPVIDVAVRLLYVGLP